MREERVSMSTPLEEDAKVYQAKPNPPPMNEAEMRCIFPQMA